MILVVFAVAWIPLASAAERPLAREALRLKLSGAQDPRYPGTHVLLTVENIAADAIRVPCQLEKYTTLSVRTASGVRTVRGHVDQHLDSLWKAWDWKTPACRGTRILPPGARYTRALEFPPVDSIMAYRLSLALPSDTSDLEMPSGAVSSEWYVLWGAPVLH
jgi:hypothetical protein